MEKSNELADGGEPPPHWNLELLCDLDFGTWSFFRCPEAFVGVATLGPRGYSFAMKTGAIFLLMALACTAAGAPTVAIGDSLTAEYDTIPENSGFPDEATAYAEVTVPGWVSMSWVEILARLR